jgi:hypothetical protein
MSLMIFCRSVHIQFTSSKRKASVKCFVMRLITRELLKTMLLVSHAIGSVCPALLVSNLRTPVVKV